MFACESSFFASLFLLLLALVDCELFFLFFSCFLFCWAFHCYSAFVWLFVFGLGRAVCLTWSCDVVSSKRCSRGPPSVPMLCCCCCSLFVAVVIRVIRLVVAVHFWRGDSQAQECFPPMQRSDTHRGVRERRPRIKAACGVHSGHGSKVHMKWYIRVILWYPDARSLSWPRRVCLVQRNGNFSSRRSSV